MAVTTSAVPSLLLLLVLGGFVLGGVALLVALIVNKRTRPFGLTLIACGAAIAVLGGVWLGYSRQVAFSHDHEILRAEQQHAADRAYVRALQAHGGEEQARLARAITRQADAHGGAAVGARLAWSGVIGLLLLVGVVYALLKNINSKRGWSEPAVFAVTGLALLFLLGLLTVRAYRQAPTGQVVAYNGPPMTAAQAWDELTRPRIQLEPQTDEVAIRGPHLTVFVSEEDTNEQLADKIRVQQDNLHAGEELTVDVHGVTFTARGRTPRDAILRSIDRARSQLAEKSAQAELAAGEPTPQKIVVNGQELSFGAGTPMTEVIEKIKEVQQQDPESLTEVKVSDQVIKVEPGDSLQGVEEALEQDDEKPRPEWVDQPAKRIGEVYRQVITTDPFATADECYADFMVRLRDATNQYAQIQLGYHGNAVAACGLTPGELATAVGVDEFLETYQGSVGPMKRLHVRVEFDQDFRDRLKRAYTLYERRGAVASITVVGGLVLLLIGGVFALLKIDEATKGYYTKRLFIGVPAVIIGLLLSAMLIDS